MLLRSSAGAKFKRGLLNVNDNGGAFSVSHLIQGIIGLRSTWPKNLEEPCSILFKD